MYEAGVDLVVTPYRGRPVESPWWRAAPNPTYREGETYAALRGRARPAQGRPLPPPGRGVARRQRRSTGSPARRSGASSRRAGGATSSGSSSGSGRTRSSSSPCRWRTSAASRPFLRERFGIPVVFYDGDVPMSLPEFGGMDTGFNYYHGADPSEYDLVLSNSEGGLDAAPRARRAPRRGGLLGGRPGVLRAAAGREGDGRLLLRLRRQVPAGVDGGAWSASRAAATRRSTSRSAAATSRATSGAPALVGDVPFNVFARAISAARVNLNVTRRSHATVPGSSTCRPFELAAAGAAIVSNPHAGIERWFEPGSELLVVEDAEARSRPTARCSTTRRRRRRWAPARESACSTSTRTRTARARLLELLGLAAPAVARVTAAAIVAIVPAFDEEGAIGGVVGEIRAFDPPFDVRRRRRRARRTSTAARRGARQAPPW